MLSIVTLCGRRDAPTDGIADYCSFLRQALAKHGVEVRSVTLSWNEKGWLQALRQLHHQSRAWPRQWVLLQYTALGWSRRGLPLGILVTMIFLRLQGFACGVVFHEPFRQGLKSITWIDHVRAKFQGWVIRSLHRLSARSIFTIPLNSVSWLPKNDSKSVFIPLGPNLPEYVAPPEGSPDRYGAGALVAIFCVSEPPYREKEIGEISYAMRSAAAAVTGLRIVFLGRGTREAEDDIAHAFHGLPVEVTILGICPLDRVSRVLAESDAMLCVRGKLNLRRGSALAGIASAVPILGYSGAADGTPLLDAGIDFVPEGDKEALGAALTRVLTDPAHRQSMREKSMRVQREHFSWDSIAESFLHSLDKVRAEG
jgi:glycosyltransferase involved in cell wall biosynthesis